MVLSTETAKKEENLPIDSVCGSCKETENVYNPKEIKNKKDATIAIKLLHPFYT